MTPPPILPPPLPPPLPPGSSGPGQRVKRQRPPLSPVRRWSRILVWSTLVVVATLRLLFPPGREAPGNAQFVQFDGGEWGNGGEHRVWGRRPSARVDPPVATVPADLWRISIEISDRDANTLRGYFWGGRNGSSDRPEVAATLREGGVVYTNVALHLKGAAGSFRPLDDKPALTLNFTKHAPGRKFHGFSKISLNNSVQDPTYVSEKLSREIFDAAGVPVPQADHATVLVNGRDLGLYVMTEGWGKPFLRRYFKNVDGNLYDGGFVRDIDGDLQINSGDDGVGREDLARLIQAASDPNPKRRWERLNAALDVDRFATLLALEVMLCHWDGYALNRNNYRVFHDRTTDRMVFMPHGLDQLFGGGGRMGPASPIEPSMNGRIARAFISLPQGHQLYLNRIAQLRTNVMVEEKLVARVHEIAAHIRPTLAAYSPDLAAEHDAYIAEMCERIGRRIRSITQQLGVPLESAVFSGDGALKLADWHPWIGSPARGLAPRFERGEVDHRKVLRIMTNRDGGAGSWRTRMRLAPGQYQFEGNVRTEGIGGKGGVFLRISGSARQYSGGHDGEWTPLTFTFEVEDGQTDTELVCDFEAAAGEASFDEGSLRLLRK